MSVNLPNRALVPSLSPLVVGVAPSSPPPPSLSPFFSNDRPFGGDTAARFLWCPTTLAGRAGRSGPDCNLGAGSGAADGRTEGVRVSEPFLRWAARRCWITCRLILRAEAELSFPACARAPTSLAPFGLQGQELCLSFFHPIQRIRCGAFRSVGAVGRSFPIPDPTAAHVVALLYDGRTGSRV